MYAAAISGFVALIYEVAWTRLLALVLGPTTYAFATMAAAFISGIAIGSALGARLARRTARAGVWLALTLVICAVAATTAAWFAAVRLPLIVAAAVAAPDAAFGPIVFWQAFGVAVLLLPTTMALGAAFPLALAVASGGSEAPIEREVALVYAANTLGAITGALAGGFVLVPLLGLRSTFHTAAFIGTVGGALCLAATLRSAGARGMRAPAFGAATAVAAGLVDHACCPPGIATLLSSGAYKYAPYLGAADLETVLRAGRLEYYKEGAAGTVSGSPTRRHALAGHRRQGRRVQCRRHADAAAARAAAGPAPSRSAGHLRDRPRQRRHARLRARAGTVHHADVVEISPEVVEASRSSIGENGRRAAKPGVRLIVGDGRSHLLLTTQPLRRHRLGAVEPVDGRRGRAVHAGVLRGGPRAAEAGRSHLPVGSHLRHQPRRSAVDRADVLVRVPAGDDVARRRRRSAADWHQRRRDRHPSPRLPLDAWRRGTAPAALADVGIAGENTPFALLSLFAGGPQELHGTAPARRSRPTTGWRWSSRRRAASTGGCRECQRRSDPRPTAAPERRRRRLSAARPTQLDVTRG